VVNVQKSAGLNSEYDIAMVRCTILPTETAGNVCAKHETSWLAINYYRKKISKLIFGTLALRQSELRDWVVFKVFAAFSVSLECRE